MSLTWTTDQIPDLAGKTFVVTGGNTGLGFETSKHLARKNAHVVIASRPEGDLPPPHEALRLIKEQVPHARVEYMPVELSSFRSIKAFADEFKSRGYPLHCLINNAGLQTPPDGTTEDGFELLMGINYLGPFFLTKLLIDRLKASAPARIVWVSSAAESIGEINWDDLKRNRGKTDMLQYGSTKLMDLMAAKEMNERLKGTGVESFACHPGLARTDIVRDPKADHSKAASVITDWASWVVGQTAEEGAVALLYTATAPELTGKGGSYYGPLYKGPMTSNLFNTSERTPDNKYATDPEACRRLYDLTEQVVTETAARALGHTSAA